MKKSLHCSQTQLKQWGVFSGDIFRNRSREIISQVSENLRTPKIEELEENLREAKERVSRTKELVNSSISIIKEAFAEFTVLSRLFGNLTKCTNEFDSENIGNNDSLRMDLALKNLKTKFNSSSESFESLAFTFTMLSRIGENLCADISEIIRAVDDFFTNKRETINRLYTDFVN